MCSVSNSDAVHAQDEPETQITYTTDTVGALELQKHLDDLGKANWDVFSVVASRTVDGTTVTEFQVTAKQQVQRPAN